MRQELRSAAHEIRNLVYRLSFLSENLSQVMTASPAREEAREMLADTVERMTRLADRLKALSAGEG
jgi:signal transduction histidine kinase